MSTALESARDEAQAVERDAVLGAGAFQSVAPEAGIAEDGAHLCRVVRVVDREGAISYVEVCACGWVSLPSVWDILSPRGCDVARSMREGVRNRRILRMLRGEA